jgi:hypothetical protein
VGEDVAEKGAGRAIEEAVDVSPMIQDGLFDGARDEVVIAWQVGNCEPIEANLADEDAVFVEDGDVVVVVTIAVIPESPEACRAEKAETGAGSIGITCKPSWERDDGRGLLLKGVLDVVVALVVAEVEDTLVGDDDLTAVEDLTGLQDGFVGVCGEEGEDFAGFGVDFVDSAGRLVGGMEARFGIEGLGGFVGGREAILAESAEEGAVLSELVEVVAFFGAYVVPFFGGGGFAIGSGTEDVVSSDQGAEVAVVGRPVCGSEVEGDGDSVFWGRGGSFLGNGGFGQGGAVGGGVTDDLRGAEVRIDHGGQVVDAIGDGAVGEKDFAGEGAGYAGHEGFLMAACAFEFFGFEAVEEVMCDGQWDAEDGAETEEDEEDAGGVGEAWGAEAEAMGVEGAEGDGGKEGNEGGEDEAGDGEVIDCVDEVGAGDGGGEGEDARADDGGGALGDEESCEVVDEACEEIGD